MIWGQDSSNAQAAAISTFAIFRLKPAQKQKGKIFWLNLCECWTEILTKRGIVCIVAVSLEGERQ